MTGDRRLCLQALSGATIYVVAGSLWAAYGLYWLGPVARPWLIAALALIVLGLCLGIVRLRMRVGRLPAHAPSGDEQRREARMGRSFMAVNAVQGVAIFLAVQVCANLGVPEYLPPAISLIVGMHFLALAPILRRPSQWFIGTTMCLLALLTVLAIPKHHTTALAAATPVLLWGVIPGIGNAFLLWSFGARSLLRAAAQLRCDPQAQLRRGSA